MSGDYGMAPTEGRVVRPERQWGFHRGTCSGALHDDYNWTLIKLEVNWWGSHYSISKMSSQDHTSATRWSAQQTSLSTLNYRCHNMLPRLHPSVSIAYAICIIFAWPHWASNWLCAKLLNQFFQFFLDLSAWVQFMASSCWCADIMCCVWLES